MSYRRKAAAAVLATGLLLTGCAGAGTTGTTGGGGADGKVVLRFVWWGNDARNQITNEVIEKFEAANPDIDVQAEPGEFSSYWDKLATQVAGNNTPDVIQMDEKYIAEYGKRGALLDLEKAGVQTDKFIEGTVDTGRVEGTLYGLNAGVNAPVVVANPTVLKAAGVAMPDDSTWTWNSLVDVSKKITEGSPDGTYGTQNMVWVEPALRAWLRQSGTDQYDENGVAWQAENLTGFFDLWMRAQREGAAPTAAETSEDTGKALDQTMAATNKIGFSVYWSNQVTALQKATGADSQLLRLPSQTGKAKDANLWYKASMFWSASSRTKNPEAAAKLINFLANDTEAGKVMGTERGVPANSEVREAISGNLTEVDKKVIAYLDEIAPELGPVPMVTPAGGGNFNVSQTRIAQELIFERLDSAQAAKQLRDEVESELK